MGKEILAYKSVASTNDVAYSLAKDGMKEGAVVLADEQTGGKGRRGRSWVSPRGTGIYLSCILRPKISPAETPKITLLAAVAVCASIRAVTGLPAMIKWPNDIVINHRKVCGILTELKAEQDRVDFVIIGIGINVTTLPGTLPKGATSLKEEFGVRAAAREFSRVDLVKKLLEELEAAYLSLAKEGFRPIIEQWRHMTAMLGSRIQVILPGRSFEGQVHDVDEDGSLVVRIESGMMERVSSGDIIMVR